MHMTDEIFEFLHKSDISDIFVQYWRQGVSELQWEWNSELTITGLEVWWNL